MPRDLDYAPLTRRPRLRDRVRGLGADTRLVMGGTVALLCFLVPAVILVVLLAVGNPPDGGGWAVLLMFLLGGAYAVVDALAQAGSGSVLASFARANELVPLGAAMAPHYGATPFASERYAVQQGVRTRDALFVEVGDRTPVTAQSAAHGEVRPEVYLRVRLPGVAEHRRGLVSPELRDALTRFAGTHRVEVTGDELTLLGSRPLDPREPGRVAEAFALADALAAAVVEQGGVRPGVGLAKPRPEPDPARGRSPWTVVAWTLALLVVGPLLIAVLFSSLEDRLRGDEAAARVVVSLVVLVVLAVVAGLVRLALRPRRRRRLRP